MHVHLIGVAGTGMGALAGLLKSAGHRVSGSDIAFYPPMGEALRAWGIELMQGYAPDHLEPAPDLVIVGNVCRRDNPEARAAIDRGLEYKSFPKAFAEFFLTGKRPLVIAGTHGKTTTSALASWLLDASGFNPSFLVGGIPNNFGESFRLGTGSAFVVEGDEYDSAFFEKIPKFWSYRPWGAVITSIEHDHVDIYPTLASYRDAFRGFVARLPPDGILVANAADAEVVAVCDRAPCRTVYYAVEGADDPVVPPTWTAAPIAPRGGTQPFELFVGGARVGIAMSPLMGAHNIANTTAVIALLAEGLDVPAPMMLGALTSFRGVKRRQELRGVAGGVRVYDDFAHHPTAVAATLEAMRAHHPEGRLVAVFEPRSATASRRTHQDGYARAFDAADLTLIAPVGRPEIPAAERLDVDALVAAIRTRGREADTVPAGESSTDALVARILSSSRPGDTITVLSNGAFGGIHDRLLRALGHAA